MLCNIHRTIAVTLLCAGLTAQFSLAADDGVKRGSKPSQLPTQSMQGAPMPFNIQLPPTRGKETAVPNTMRESISPEARSNFISNLMAVNPFSMQEMIAMMAVKYPAKEGLSFDDVIESMKTKANELNFKYVGVNPLWKDVIAISGKTDTPRVEFYSFCDAMIARELLDLSLEFAIFLPCRIAIMEDAQKNIWILTLDWDSTWLDHAGKSMGITPELRAAAIDIRGKLDEMMRAAANGDL